MKKSILIILSISLLLVGTNVKAQTNLVPNGDFETYSSLPDGPMELNRAVGWNNVNGNYQVAGYGSPDYYYLGGFGAVGTIIPYSGNGQVGLALYCAPDNFREYISTQLISHLDSGRDYFLSYYLYHNTAGDPNNGGCSKSCSNMGVHFSNNQLSQSFSEPISVIPQIEIDTIINYMNNWEKYTFIFTSTDSSKYITIGNFRDNLNTLISVSGNTCAYYWLDKIELYPYFTIKGDTLICKGNTDTLKAYGNTTVKWADSLNPNIIIATDSLITVSPDITTTYAAYGNWDTTYFTVHVVSNPVVNLGNDTALCEGQTLLINAANPYITSYLWQDNSTNAIYNITQTGTYWVKASITNSCFASDTINVTYKPNPVVNLGNDTTLCYGQTIILNATMPNATYQWQDGSTNSVYKIQPPYLPYNFWVKVTVNNCTGSDTIGLNINMVNQISLGNDTTLCQGQTITLNATIPNATYHWQDSSTASFYTVTQQGLYWVTATDDNYCRVSDTISIMYDDCNPTDIYIPNAFTPAGSVNNIFKIVTLAEFSEFNMSIYYRWHGQLFESTDKNKGWDGTYRGKLVPSGVYVYLITGTIKDTGEYIKRTGTVTVVR
ncbi:MAG: gliding motility-associated C-terminal domain-containing protein [Bacteroidota bacterium]